MTRLRREDRARMRAWCLLAAVCATAAAGCSSDEQQAPPSQAPCGGRGDELSGLVAEGEAGLELRFIDIDPTPPVVGDNSWLVSLEGPDGPIEGAEEQIVVTPRMPDHGHGTPREVGVTEEADGVYQLDPVNTFMPGYWEVTVELDGDELQDSVQFGICLQ